MEDYTSQAEVDFMSSRGTHNWRLMGVCGIVLLLGVGGGTMTGQTKKSGAATATQFINPPEIAAPRGYTHVVVARPERIVYISGQVALDAQGQLVGKGDMRAQLTQALKNMTAALATAGAKWDNVVKVNWYFVNYRGDALPIIREVRDQFITGAHPPASTLVGVAALAREDFLVEVEAVAVLP